MTFAVGFRRYEGPVVGHPRFAVDTDHLRHVRPVDVAVEQADAGARVGCPAARFVATVVFPTPPFPEETAITLRTPGSGSAELR